MKKVVFLLISLLLLSSFNIYATEDAKVVQKEVIVQNVNKQEIEIEKEPVEYGIDITFDNSEDGVVSVFYYQKDPSKMKLTVSLGKERYVYNVFSNEEVINYPLQLGEGDYTVALYENTTGNKYKKVANESKKVEFVDDNAVYLQSILEINWDEDDESIKLAQELVDEALEAKKSKVTKAKRDDVELTELEVINAIYNYVIETIEYDFEKIKTTDFSYLPVNDVTIDIKTGICYDYSSLFASMLRSQGIPAKMIKGYKVGSKTYHAWNEVYLESEERWIVMDTTYDAYYAQNNKKYTFEKEADDFDKKKEL